MLYQLMNCFPKAGIPVQTNPTHLPLPKNIDHVHHTQSALWSGKSTTGPDAVIYTDVVHCIDLTIVSARNELDRREQRNAITRAEHDKDRTYKEWREHYNMRCEPVVITTNGVLAQKTTKLLRRLR